ncbi:MAG: oligosaccharide flippase family protein [Caldimonas sp.]
MDTKPQGNGPVAKSILVYACAFAVAGATPFVLLPLLTKQLSPLQFGEVTSFLMLAAMIGNIAGLSSHGLVAVRYFKTGAREYSGIVSSAVLAVLAAHVLVAFVVALLFPQLRRVFELPLGLMLFAVLTASFLSLNLIFLAIFQSSGQPVRYLTARLVQGFIEIVLCVGLIYFLSMGSGSRIYSYALALAASAGVGIVYGLRKGYLGRQASRDHAKVLLAFGVPMLPHIAAGTAITYLDRLMVSTLLGVESLGIYMVAMQIGMVMVAIIEPLNKALAPWLFEQLAKDDAAVRISVVRKTYRFYASLAMAGTVIAVLAQVFFDILIGPRYAAAKTLIPWMVAGFVLQGMYYTVVNYLFYAERTGRLSIMSSFTAALGCALSYTLVSTLGLVGAGVSFALNNAILFGLVWLAAAKAVAMPWRLRSSPT